MRLITHLLDTQAWIWFFNRDPRARALVTALPAEVRLGISAITVWEAAMLETKGRVRFHPDLASRIREMLARNLCAVAPLLPEIAIASSQLENFHGDPADRIIVATAKHTGSTLVTADGKVLAWAATVTGRLAVLPV
ncbi:MAG TPA: type II toxin-antitoxin system VapC family toxin [Chthoniobacterales bacterium]